MPARGPKEDVAGPVSGVGTKNTSFGATGEPPRSAGGESVGDEPPGTASHGAPAVPALGTKPNSPLAAPGEEEVIPHGALGPDAPNPGVGPARGQAEAETAGGSIGKSLKSLGQSLKADVVQGAVTFGAGVLKSYFVNKIDEKNIREGINEKWPEVQRQIRIFSPRIAALKDASPEKIYAVIKVTVVRGRVFWPGQLAESLGEVTESLAQVENVSVTEVGTAEKIEAEHSVPVEGILSMAFTHKTEFTFSILLWDRNAGVIGGSR
jgi:hypothetical protein